MVAAPGAAGGWWRRPCVRAKLSSEASRACRRPSPAPAQNWLALLGSHCSSRTMDGSLLAPLMNSSRDSLPAGEARISWTAPGLHTAPVLASLVLALHPCPGSSYRCTHVELTGFAEQEADIHRGLSLRFPAKSSFVRREYSMQVQPRHAQGFKAHPAWVVPAAQGPSPGCKALLGSKLASCLLCGPLPNSVAGQATASLLLVPPPPPS